MANQLYIPNLNPIQFYWTDRPIVVGKSFYHLDEEWFIKQIPAFMQKINYFQKWQQTDTIYLQIQTNFDPIKLELIDCIGKVVKTANFVIKPTTIIGQPFNVYEVSMQLADVPEGDYYPLLTAGSGDNIMQWLGEPMLIALSWPDTMLTKYKNTINTLDTIFATGIEFSFRCESILNGYLPGNKSALYDDQILNLVQLSAIPFDQFKLSIGGSYGVPDWVPQKINTIYCCDTVIVEGKQLVRGDGAKMEVNRDKLYPMAGWTMDVRPAKNRFSSIGDTTFNAKVAVTYNIEARVFGTMNAVPTTNTIQIVEIENG